MKMIESLVARLARLFKKSEPREQPQPSEGALDALCIEFRRMVEAGVILTSEGWASWPTWAQNLWLSERERYWRICQANATQMLVDAMQGGTLAEDAVMEELPEETQDSILKQRLEVQRHQREMMERMNLVR